MTRADKLQKAVLILFPIILCFYFFGTFISNVVTLSPTLHAFFTGGISRYIWRAVVALVYGAYIVFASVVFKIKFDRRLLIFSGFVLFIVLISPLFNLEPLHTQYIDQWYRLVAIDVNVGFAEIIAYYGNAFFSFLFMFSIFFVLPTLFKKSKAPFIVFWLFIAVMIVACLYSYSVEFSKYLHFTNVVYEKGIRSFFPSKNAFGSFLFIAFLISIYMVFAGGWNFKSKFTNLNRIFWIIGWTLLAIVFLITLVFTLNKNSIGAALLLLFLLPLVTLFKKSRSKKFKIILFSSYASVFVLGVVLILVAPSLRRIVGGLFESVDGRNDLLLLFFENLRGAQIFTGFGHTLSHRLFLWSNNIGTYIIMNNIHNAFITILGEGGIVYLAFYIGLIVYNFTILFKQRENILSRIAIAILIAFIFSSFFESTQLYISGSSGSSLISVLIISIPLSFATKKVDRKKLENLSEVQYEII